MSFSVVLQVPNDHSMLMGRALTGNKHKFKTHFNHLSKHPADETEISLRFFKKHRLGFTFSECRCLH